MVDVIRLHAELTKHGLVALWEQGGGMTHTGYAEIIATEKGEIPTAVYMPRSGHLSCGKHALIPVRPYFYLIKTNRSRGEIEHSIYKITRVSKIGDPHVELTLVNKFDRGEWDSPLEDFLVDAVNAAEDKVNSYHCRAAIYAKLKAQG